MPYGIRFVCLQIFQALFQLFSSESQQLLLQTIGNWLWKFYLQPALLTPEIAKVLNKISFGRLFGGENISKNNENEMLGVSSIEIQMKLNPKLHSIENPEADIKAPFMETKRCVLYITRVQTGSNLVEILNTPGNPRRRK
ncbi:putative ras gtpase activating protein [Erysiphe necator]|uniref:Putative ras gtpase activating protein n=1 Tax=Uncinula necator TaxID=52586 RepID=A0A0B1PH45_UNCNE|nr:putative ras gtpase activating protein [Erysiphe necator]